MQIRLLIPSWCCVVNMQFFVFKRCIFAILKRPSRRLILHLLRHSLLELNREWQSLIASLVQTKYLLQTQSSRRIVFDYQLIITRPTIIVIVWLTAVVQSVESWTTLGQTSLSSPNRFAANETSKVQFYVPAKSSVLLIPIDWFYLDSTETTRTGQEDYFSTQGSSLSFSIGVKNNNRKYQCG